MWTREKIIEKCRSIGLISFNQSAWSNFIKFKFPDGICVYKSKGTDKIKVIDWTAEAILYNNRFGVKFLTKISDTEYKFGKWFRDNQQIEDEFEKFCLLFKELKNKSKIKSIEKDFK